MLIYYIFEANFFAVISTSYFLCTLNTHSHSMTKESLVIIFQKLFKHFFFLNQYKFEPCTWRCFGGGFVDFILNKPFDLNTTCSHKKVQILVTWQQNGFQHVGYGTLTLGHFQVWVIFLNKIDSMLQVFFFFLAYYTTKTPLIYPTKKHHKRFNSGSEIENAFITAEQLHCNCI